MLFLAEDILKFFTVVLDITDVASALPHCSNICYNLSYTTIIMLC